MKPSELFDLWAPPDAVWSKWAKPVLFAEMSGVSEADPNSDPLPALSMPLDARTAVIVDLPGAASVKGGLTLLGAGFRPVPLFNGNRGPFTLNFTSAAVVDNNPIIAWLLAGIPLLERQALPYDAPPVFLLDSRRQTQVTPSPGRFDNRWMVFPQDFPSANFLKSEGITRATLVQSSLGMHPPEDLAHVLRRWQEAGIALSVYDPSAVTGTQPLVVRRPSQFRALWYAALAAMGLRRNSAGGFGSVIPEAVSSAG